MDELDLLRLELFCERKTTEFDDFKDTYLKTKKEWSKFVDGGNDIDTNIVPPEILAAWVRCRDFGIDPFKVPEKNILTGNALRALLKKNQAFIEVSRPFLTNLHQFLKDSGFRVTLFSREGYLLEILGNNQWDDFARELGSAVGALFSEKSAGHNVAGAIVELKKPVQIFGSQYYNIVYQGVTGSGAPIFSQEGDFLGGITLHAACYRFNQHTMGMTVAAAYAIENELRSRKAFAKYQRAYKYQQTVIASTMEAMIAVDNDGFISLINNPAKKLFALPISHLEGKVLRNVITINNAKLINIIENNDHVTDQEISIFTRGIWNDYTVTITPILSVKNKAIGKVIVINEIKRAKTMVTKMVGARAVYQFEDICGQNPRFMITMEQAQVVAQNDSNVLLLGKSGTGKDVFAQSIHNASSRNNGPYVAINCGAIPRDLVANELFGHEEGAFTGSRRGGNQGKFELADGGTIFLDEIAEMPMELQPVLLRVIEDKSIVRVGGRKTRQIDVRIIAATNKNLREEIEKKNFREDLFYRLNVFSIEMIPLCERPDDIPRLTRLFIKKYEDILNKKIHHVDERILESFKHYPWPGNIRELQNVIERMMNFAPKNELTYNLMPQDIIKSKRMPDNLDALESPEEKEKKIVQKMLDLKFNKMQIAERLNISRATLYRKIKKYDLI